MGVEGRDQFCSLMLDTDWQQLLLQGVIFTSGTHSSRTSEDIMSNSLGPSLPSLSHTSHLLSYPKSTVLVNFIPGKICTDFPEMRSLYIPDGAYRSWTRSVWLKAHLVQQQARCRYIQSISQELRTACNQTCGSRQGKVLLSAPAHCAPPWASS